MRLSFTIAALALCLPMLPRGLAAAGDAPLRAPADIREFSPNRRYVLISEIRARRTRVFRTASTQTALWEVPEYLPVPALSDDGQLVASLIAGGNILPSDVKPGDALLTLYASSGAKHVVRVGEVIADLSRLPHSASGRPWGRMLGFQHSGQLLLAMQDGRSVLLDAEGKQTLAAHAPRR